jgi:acetylglutamate kinase
MENENADLVAEVKRNTPAGSLVVVKYGGHAMEDDTAKSSFCHDIAALCDFGIIPVIVHGGGPQIKKMLGTMGLQSTFLNGLRVTDKQTMEVAQMVLCGSINKDIVRRISGLPGTRGALGLSGLDSKLIEARVKDPELGFVGEPTKIDSTIIRQLIELKLVPVIAPIGIDVATGQALNINADTAAGAVAEALQADRLLLLTDIIGVLDKEKRLIEEIGSSQFAGLVEDGTITGGMIPKLETAVQGVQKGIGAVSITDGREQSCVLKALSGRMFGTKIVK